MGVFEKGVVLSPPFRNLLVELSEPYRSSLKAGAASEKKTEKSAALLDQYIPEFETVIEGELIDWMFVPSYGRRYKWNRAGARVKRFPLTALQRSVYSKWMNRRAGGGRSYLSTELKTAEWLALRYAEALPHDVTRLVVFQDFLPFLWLVGALKDREYEVLLTRPPFTAIAEKLQTALPKSKAVAEFRVEEALIRAEAEALEKAERVITPHEEYAKYFENVRIVEWEPPQVVPPAAVRQPKAFLFPADLVAREGAHAALAAAEALEIPLLVVGSNAEGLAVDSDLVMFIKRSEIPWHEIAAVVHPTLFESWPRLHLYAKTLGIPVVGTESIGLSEGEGVHFVPFGDEEELRKTLERVLARETDRPFEPRVRPRSFGDSLNQSS